MVLLRVINAAEKQTKTATLTSLPLTSNLADTTPTPVHNLEADDVQIPAIAGTFDDIHGGLGGGKSVMGVPCRPAVHQIASTVDLVQSVDRRMKRSTRHCVRSSEDVADIPSNEWERDEEPCNQGWRWPVNVAAEGRFRCHRFAAESDRSLSDEDGW